MTDRSGAPASRPSFRREFARARLTNNTQDDTAAGQTAPHLRRALDVMFPPAYIQLFHRPPHSVCSPFALKARPAHPNSGARAASDSEWPLRDLEPSSEPSSRVQVVQLQEWLQESLTEHQAKPVGLCPIRRAIYDQCFDELVRQVTVGCVEQGLLLFRVRNELRMTMGCYRRTYESAVRFGLAKAVDARLRVAQVEERELRVQRDEAAARNNLQRGPSGGRAEIDEDETTREQRARSQTKLREFYEGELAKRDQVIVQQRAIIKAFSQKPAS